MSTVSYALEKRARANDIVVDQKIRVATRAGMMKMMMPNVVAARREAFGGEGRLNGTRGQCLESGARPQLVQMYCGSIKHHRAVQEHGPTFFLTLTPISKFVHLTKIYT